jgi:hypothetical protein
LESRALFAPLFKAKLYKRGEWLLGQDSNLQPSGYKRPKISSGLGLSLHPSRTVGLRVPGASPGGCPEYELAL